MTRAYTSAPSAYTTYTQSPAYAGVSPAYAAASPAYAATAPVYGPTHAFSTPGPPASASLVSAPMQGGPVLPAISELQRHPDPAQTHLRPLFSSPSVTTAVPQGPPGSNGSPPSQMLKRAPSQTPLPEESPAKKQSKWTPEEDNLTIELRGQGMKWDDIAKRLPGRSSISCRLRYQNYLEKRAVWDEEKKNKLARLYARYVQAFPHLVVFRSYHREVPRRLFGVCIPHPPLNNVREAILRSQRECRSGVPVVSLLLCMRACTSQPFLLDRLY